MEREKERERVRERGKERVDYICTYKIVATVSYISELH